MPSQNRIAHVTFHKCGSQWVRDVLTAPEILKHSGTPLYQSGQKLSKSWPEQPAGTFMGPIYAKTKEDWEQKQQEGDKAVVVLRDPRDRLVSWVFHRAFQQAISLKKQALPEIFLLLPMRQRFALAMILNKADHAIMRSWAGKVTDEWTFMTSYEKLIANPLLEFGAILSFLGWQVPDAVLISVVDRLSFAQRSGRQPGEVNVYSHYRKGMSGDWRNYFDAKLGSLWEDYFPHLLTELGYESREDWHHHLPSRPELDEDNSIDPLITPANVRLQAQLVKLQETNAELRRQVVQLSGTDKSWKQGGIPAPQGQQ